MAKARLERAMQQLNAVADLHYLDLLAYRLVSNYVADTLQEVHESPQMLLLMGGEVVLNQTHMDINPQEIVEVIKQTA